MAETVLQTIVEKKHYRFIDGEGVDWKEAVRMSAESLVADGSVAEDYYKQIIECIEKYGPYVVFDHNVAMPHTTENATGAYKTGIGFMASKKLIDFGKDEDGEEKKANLFFTLSSTNPDEHFANIQQLTSIFMNEPLLDALAAANTPEDILEAEKKYPCEDEF
jgi:PTS system ascorbate-specific IIA component